jgi:hypothetical protein
MKLSHRMQTLSARKPASLLSSGSSTTIPEPSIQAMSGTVGSGNSTTCPTGFSTGDIGLRTKPRLAGKYGSSKEPSSKITAALEAKRSHNGSEAKGGSRQTRSLNRAELKLAVELTWLTTSLINRHDELKNTSLFQQDLKAASNTFLRVIEKYCQKHIWAEIAGKEGCHDAMHQGVMGSELVDRLVDIGYEVNMRSDDERREFGQAFEAFLRQFNLSLEEQ